MLSRPSPAVTIAFLGGLGDIGRNCALVGVDDRFVVLDCGILFPSPDMPGVEAVLPDLDVIEAEAERVEAVVFTHGHEDHIGGVVDLARILDVPIYGSRLTIELVRSKLEEAGMGERELHPVADGDIVDVGPFQVEFLPITHSIPSGFATIWHTPQGLLLHSGDYKLDPDPIDERVSDLARIDDAATSPGIRLLLADSTNAEDEGFTAPERTVGEALAEIIEARPDRRIIAGCFSSHLHRIQQLVDIAERTGRFVCPVGRSLRRNLMIARDVGVIRVPAEHIIEPEELWRHEPGRVMVLSTGSQGEPRAGLSLMAAGEHKNVQLGGSDTLILSSHPIPGNEFAINQIIDRAMRLGVEVVHSRMFKVHVSGHARQGEIAQLLDHARPEWFAPVHGEFRHLTRQARLGVERGIPPEHVVVALDGDELVLVEEGLRVQKRSSGRYRYRHGLPDDINGPLLADRLSLGQEGFVAVVAAVDPERLELVGDVRILSRGWIDTDAPGGVALVEGAASQARAELERALSVGVDELGELERVARRATGRFVGDNTRRRPMIVPSVSFVRP